MILNCLEINGQEVLLDIIYYSIIFFLNLVCILHLFIFYTFKALIKSNKIFKAK